VVMALCQTGNPHFRAFQFTRKSRCWVVCTQSRTREHSRWRFQTSATSARRRRSNHCVAADALHLLVRISVALRRQLRNRSLPRFPRHNSTATMSSLRSCARMRCCGIGCPRRCSSGFTWHIGNGATDKSRLRNGSSDVSHDNS